MKYRCKYKLSALFLFSMICISCKTFEKASQHGFHSGYYKMRSAQDPAQTVYVDRTGDKVEVFRMQDTKPDPNVSIGFTLDSEESKPINKLIFSKKSLDIDLATILLKYRPPVHGLPAQLTTDLNISLYAGWRQDRYALSSKTDPLGRHISRVSSRGYDLGLFGGIGTTPITPFTTQNKRDYEYSGMILQAGVAGFLEFNVASFGFALGLDYLLNSDREVWIYQNKPWVGFMVGVALN